jgi:hypothetical protein
MGVYTRGAPEALIFRWWTQVFISGHRLVDGVRGMFASSNEQLKMG